MNEKDSRNICACPHHKALPILLIVFGLIWLLRALDILGTYFGYVSEIILAITVVVGGGIWLGSRRCNCCSDKRSF
ncbi:MAG: hypothetical protein A2928_03110 [Candidatus Taylorbacteria bacterium RIFCSPLOWO2_01_FULL_45_15b]|uniref:DUF5668 domain-containing protein n=1 Tax=Candidatus Taylorbacteria bacterium RIFCSPLOWO2_01_FULL_45_15b TaxID=1802319 RepID=A0A1G2NAK6_9BACT|nr:MAG: hypothetical protein A2928_03110 [Candidatus Taylorbacteria bacterium RIFCSPLOWO2_01_FULL_45_15b]